MEKDLRDSILETFEHCLDAQLRAVRRLRKGGVEEKGASSISRSMSQIDMAYNILQKAHKPLHITELLTGIEKAFRVKVDRESLVSSLTKKVARGDRFVRTGKNTFALKESPS